jgi:hypothetical protein
MRGTHDAQNQTTFAGEEAMKVKYTEYAPDPKLRNTITHLPPHVAQNLIAQGVCVHVPYKNFVEFMSAEHREGNDPNNVNPPQAKGVEWSCTRLFDRPVIFRKSGFETTRIETLEVAIQCGCPESVLRQFRAFEDVLTGIAACEETVVQEQYRAAARASADRVGVLKQIFSRY